MTATDFLDAPATSASDFLDAPETPAPISASPVNQPSQFSSGLPPGTPTAENPDWSLTKAASDPVTGVPARLAQGVDVVQQRVIEPTAAFLWNTAAKFGESEAGIPPSDDEYFKPGKPIIPDAILPLAKEKGVIPALTRAVQGLSTPGNLAMLPLAAGEGVLSKIVQGLFLTGTAASITQSVQVLAEAKTPDEIKDATTELGINLAMAELMRRGLKPKPDGPIQGPLATGKVLQTPPGAKPTGNGMFDTAPQPAPVPEATPAQKVAQQRRAAMKATMRGNPFATVTLHLEPAPQPQTVQPPTAPVAVKPDATKPAHIAVYGGKEVPVSLEPKPGESPVQRTQREFKVTAQRVRDNLKTGEKGYVKVPNGKIFEISAASKMAKLVKEIPPAKESGFAFTPDQEVMVTLTGKKWQRAKVVQVQPDGSAQVKLKDGSFRWLKPSQVAKTTRDANKDLNQQNLAGLTPEQAKKTKADAKAFVNLVKSEGPRFGWYDAEHDTGVLKAQGFEASRAVKAGVRQAFKDAGIEGDPENVIDQAKGLEKLKKHVEENIGSDEQKQNFKAATSDGKQLVATDEMVKGDDLDIDGTMVKVASKNDETGEVVLEDGRRFGVQKLEGGESIYVESHNQVEGEGSTDFVPEEEKPFLHKEGDRIALSGGDKFHQDVAGMIYQVHNDGKVLDIIPDGKDYPIRITVEDYKKVEAAKPDPAKPPANTPKLRPGEKGTGSLIGEDEAFNLAGEKGADTDRIAKEKADAEAAQQANEQFQAEHQQEFPQGPGAKTKATSNRPEPTESYEGTALKNAVADFERATHGYPEAPPTEKREMAIQWENARETLYQDPTAGRRLADQLIADPTMFLNDTQSAVLLHHKVDTENALNNAAEKTWTAETPEEKTAAQLEYNRQNEHFQQLLDAIKERGSHWGREGRWRQALAFEDYSFASREARLRAANGGRELTESEHAGLRAKIEALQKNQAEMQANEQKKIDEAVNEALRKVAQNAQPKIPPYIVQIAERIRAKLHAQADESRAYLRGKTFTIGQDVLFHLSRIGADAIYETGLDFAKWSAKMVGEFGDKIKPHLQQVFDASKKVLKSLADAETAKRPSKVKAAVKTAVAKTPDEKIDAIKTKISDNLKKDKKNSVSVYVQRMARIFYENGVRGRNGIVDAVHRVMKEIVPDFTREQTVRAFSGYGDFSPLSKEQVTVALRGYKGELQQVEKLRDMAQGIPPHKTGIERRTPTDQEKKLIAAVNRAKVKFQVPITDPATQLKSALDTRKAQLETQIKDYTDRLANKEFDRPPRRNLVLDRRASELTAERDRIKQKFQDAERNAMLKNRPTYQKVLDFFTKFLRREFVLSSPASIGKLTMAALHGLTLEPIKEGVGVVIAKALPGFASRLKTEASSSAKIEARALAKAFTNTARDAAQTIRTGKSDLEMRYGGRKAVPEEMVSYFGRLHAALKTPLKRAAFERVYAKLAEQEIQSGNDPRDVLVDMRIGNLAMKEANRMLYLEDNKLVSAYQRFLSAFEQKDTATGKPSPTGTLAAGVLRWTLPIVRIPTNLIARTIQSSIGFPVGATKLAYAYAKGIQELPQEHADLIMRQLKAGSIGGAFLLYGYFNADKFGGFYQPGEKRKPDELRPGEMKIGGLVIPALALHRQEFVAMQLGAAIYKVVHSKIRKKDMEEAGIGEGAMAGILGLTSETPMVNETLESSRMFNKYERDKYLDQQVANFINPQFVQWVARQLDKQKPFSLTENPVQRKPENLKQAIEMGIPGMRQNVPESKNQPSTIIPAAPHSLGLDVTNTTAQ